MKEGGAVIEARGARRGRLLGLAGLALLVACGGGGGASGTTPFTEGDGSSPFGSGSGSPPFGTGAGGGLAGDGPRPAADPAVVVSDDAIQGTVIDARSGSPLVGAAVRFTGTTLTTGSTGGFAQATSAAIPRLVLEGAADNHETLYSPTEVLGAAAPSVSLLRLTPFGTTSDITVAAGGVVTDTATTTAVTLPANALVAAGGGPAPPTVGVRVTQIAVGNDSHLLSGDYTDIASTPLETFGGANLSSLVPVDVASGQQLTLRIPASSRSASPPATANLYRLDPASGRWAQDGTATLSGGAYTATVAYFGQWMVGLPITSPVTVTGCVVDDSALPAANVRIEAEGINYSGIAQATTNSQGQFTVLARPSSRLLVQGRRGAFLTNATSVDVSTTAFNITTCLTLPTTNAVTARLTWGARPSDIDSHLHVPGGAHVYFSSKGSLSAEPFASLDVDDVTGFGPEVTTMRRPKAGIYRFYLHNYSGTFLPGMTESPTRVELNYVGRTVVFTPPAGEGGALWWHLFDLEIQSNCTMVLYRYNRWRADEPANPNSVATATECIP